MSDMHFFWSPAAYADELAFWVREMDRRIDAEEVGASPSPEFESLRLQAQRSIDAYRISTDADRGKIAGELRDLMRRISATVSEASGARVAIL